MAVKTVAIFGTSKALPGDSVFDQAAALGRALAENGYRIANGGYGGVMLASAKGARGAGGHVIGVTCEAFKRSGANEYVTEEIRTPVLELRAKTHRTWRRLCRIAGRDRHPARIGGHLGTQKQRLCGSGQTDYNGGTVLEAAYTADGPGRPGSSKERFPGLRRSGHNRPVKKCVRL